MKEFTEMVCFNKPLYRVLNNDSYILNVSKTEYYESSLKYGGVIINGDTYKYDKQKDKLTRICK